MPPRSRPDPLQPSWKGAVVPLHPTHSPVSVSPRTVYVPSGRLRASERERERRNCDGDGDVDMREPRKGEYDPYREHEHYRGSDRDRERNTYRESHGGDRTPRHTTSSLTSGQFFFEPNTAGIQRTPFEFMFNRETPLAGTFRGMGMSLGMGTDRLELPSWVRSPRTATHGTITTTASPMRRRNSDSTSGTEAHGYKSVPSSPRTARPYRSNVPAVVRGKTPKTAHFKPYDWPPRSPPRSARYDFDKSRHNSHSHSHSHSYSGKGNDTGNDTCNSREEGTPRAARYWRASCDDGSYQSVRTLQPLEIQAPRPCGRISIPSLETDTGCSSVTDRAGALARSKSPTAEAGDSLPSSPEPGQINEDGTPVQRRTSLASETRTAETPAEALAAEPASHVPAVAPSSHTPPPKADIVFVIKQEVVPAPVVEPKTEPKTPVSSPMEEDTPRSTPRATDTPGDSHRYSGARSRATRSESVPPEDSPTQGPAVSGAPVTQQPTPDALQVAEEQPLILSATLPWFPQPAEVAKQREVTPDEAMVLPRCRRDASESAAPHLHVPPIQVGAIMEIISPAAAGTLTSNQYDPSLLHPKPGYPTGAGYAGDGELLSRHPPHKLLESSNQQSQSASSASASASATPSASASASYPQLVQMPPLQQALQQPTDHMTHSSHTKHHVQVPVHQTHQVLRQYNQQPHPRRVSVPYNPSVHNSGEPDQGPKKPHTNWNWPVCTAGPRIGYTCSMLFLGGTKFVCENCNAPMDRFTPLR